MKLGKIFLIITLIGAAAALALGIMVVMQKNELSENLKSTSTKLQSTTTSLETTKKSLTESETKLKETDTQLTEAKTRSETLQASLTAAETKAKKLDDDLKTATTKVTEAEAKVEEVNKALGGKSAVELKQEALKAQEDLTLLQREKKIIDDQLAAVQAEITNLKDIMERGKTGAMPPGINGKILSVNRAWNFVVLNVGTKDGVVENGVLMVYRGNTLLGKVKVVSAEKNSSVADVIPEWIKGEIQSGDAVFN